MHTHWVQRVSVAVFVTAFLAAGPVRAGDIYKPFKLLVQPLEAMHREKPATCKDCSIEQLADQIDWLEHHIDTYGSIVAKHPDVWGESRLMRHRYEYEEQMASQLDKFEVRMNAALRRSDQSFLGMAMALQAATGEASIPRPFPTSITDSTETTTTTQSVFTQVNGMLSDPNATSNGPVTRTAPFRLPTDGTGFSFEQSNLSLEPTTQLDQLSRYLNHLHELRRINEGDDIADSPGYALNLVRIPVSVLPGKQTRKGYGAEITITAEPYLTDELLPTTFRNLVINDVVDQLAYPMTRVVNSFDDDLKARLHSIARHHFFVSTNPDLRQFSHRLCGCDPLSQSKPCEVLRAADIKKALSQAQEKKDHLLAALLAVRLENLGVQDIVDRRGQEVAKAKQQNSWSKLSLEEQSDREKAIRDAANEQIIKGLRAGFGLDASDDVRLDAESSQHSMASGEEAARQQVFENMRERILLLPDTSEADRSTRGAALLFAPQPTQDSAVSVKALAEKKANELSQYAKAMSDSDSELKKVIADLRKVFAQDLVVTVPVARSRRARMPIPPTQILATYDLILLAHVAADAHAGLENNPVDRDRLHLMDVRGFLLEEIEGAYEYLSRPENQHLWEACDPFPLNDKLSLAEAVRVQDRKRLEEIRRKFLVDADASAGYAGLADCDTTRALAWMILVQAALLNDRLIQDIKEATVSKGCTTCFADTQGLEFYQPRPCPQAIAAFNEYVKCRWPIRVFALDPVTQDQNVADEYSRRRELQVAAALAFASGQMNGQALMRFTRRLEWDIATIALNRTAVAFSHGNDTFGWRFQPRFQTPPTPGTLKTLGETLLGGPTRDADMCQRELESGIRECTAIVVMPSFVPYATFDVRTNWYRLTDPKCTEISMRETMELSRAITAMKNSAAQCSRCAHLYREGEVDRLLRRVDQLDRELPLQTMRVQIPYENTSGGFEIFNRGITELAPELIGWYGAPGVNPASATVMFLVGDGFSVHDTQVIAGGRAVPFQLISRQLMKVQIPSGLQTLSRGRSEPGGDFNPQELEEVVDVHLATPYGVSSHLLVPVADGGVTPVAQHFEMRPEAEFGLFYKYAESGDTKTAPVNSFFLFNQNAVVIHAPRIAEIQEKVDVTFSLTDASDKTYLGSFQVADVPFNAYAYEYYITADKLKSLINGTNMLGDVVEPYLVYKGGKATITVEVTATVSATNVPVAGRFTAVCKPTK